MYRYCDLSKTISEFYLQDLKCAEEAKRGLMLPAREEWLFKEFSELGEVIFKFGLSACIGEARHFELSTTATFDDVSGLRDRDFIAGGKLSKELFKEILCINFSCLSGSDIRRKIYRKIVPSEDWGRILDILEELFNLPLWSNNYGGNSWLAGVKALKELKESLWGSSLLSELVVAADFFINVCHNLGFLLNKFNCRAFFHIEKVLDAKKRGELLYLQCTRDCDVTCSGICTRVVWKSKG